MQTHFVRAIFKILVLGIPLVLLGESHAQLNPASPPIADPADARFKGAIEDLTTPSLSDSKLMPIPPMVGFKNDHEQYTEELVQLQWRFGDPLDVYVLKPKGVTRPPVILYLYGFPSETDRFKVENFQRSATKDGFAAVGFLSALTGHRYHDRPMKEWFISELQECLTTSAHDVQMVLDYLDKRGDLDMDRVGMFSQGSGASIGILTSAVEPRIKVLDALDPWGDWPAWMKDSPIIPEEERADFVKPEFLKRVAGLEPIDWLPRVQAKRFRLQDATFETNTPTSAKEKLRAAVPQGSTVVIYPTVEKFNAVIQNGRELDWIKNEVRSLPTQEASAAGSK